MSSAVERALTGSRRSAAAALRSPRTLALLIVCLGIVVLVPLAVTLLRAEAYRSSSAIKLASSELIAERSVQIRGVENLLKSQLKSETVQEKILDRAQWLGTADDVPDHVRLRGAPEADPLEVVVHVQAPSARDARQLAGVAAAELVEAAEPTARFVRLGLLRFTRKALRREDVSDENERTLREREEALGQAVRADDDVFDPRPSGAPLPAERFADRIFGALPGRTPPRPHPVWAVAAGLILASALAVWLLVLAGLERNTADSRSDHGT